MSDLQSCCSGEHVHGEGWFSRDTDGDASKDDFRNDMYEKREEDVWGEKRKAGRRNDSNKWLQRSVRRDFAPKVSAIMSER